VSDAAPAPDPAGGPRWRRWGAVCALALALALGAGSAAWAPDAPVALGRRTVDGLGSWWFQWWVDLALRTDAGLARTDLLFYPWGKDILRDTGANLVDALAAVPVRRLFGPVVAWNALYIGILALNGAAAGGWLLRRGAGLSAALAATALATLHPYALMELDQGRPTQALLAPLILALGMSEAAFSAERTRAALGWAVGAGAALALAGWTYWYGGGFAVLGVLALALGRPTVRRALTLGTIGLVSFALAAPAAVPLLHALADQGFGGALPVEAWRAGRADFTNASGDTVALCTVREGWAIGYLTQTSWLRVASAGGVVATLAALAAGLASWRWWVVLGLALGIALGPFPGGVQNPVYIGLASLLPPFERLYWPCRALALAVPVGALGIGALVDRLRGRRALGAVVAALLALGAAGEAVRDEVLPMASWDPAVAPGWSCLRGEEGAVLVIPYGVDHEQLLTQTAHGRPMFGGMNERSIALVPDDQLALRRANSWLAAVIAAGPNPRDRSTWTPEDRAAIGALGYRWLVVRVDAMADRHRSVGAHQRMRAARFRFEELAGEPVYADGDVFIYAPWGGGLTCGSATGAPGSAAPLGKTPPPG
jgi:hypothetical protein